LHAFKIQRYPVDVAVDDTTQQDTYNQAVLSSSRCRERCHTRAVEGVGVQFISPWKPIEPTVTCTAVSVCILIQLEAGHSVECITHAGHSIAFNNYGFAPCDLVTMTFDLLT